MNENATIACIIFSFMGIGLIALCFQGFKELKETRINGEVEMKRIELQIEMVKAGMTNDISLTSTE